MKTKFRTPFNLNNNVYFTLTDKGKILFEGDADLDAAAIVSQRHYYKMQMWCFMQKFGEYMVNGLNPVVETTVEFDIEIDMEIKIT